MNKNNNKIFIFDVDGTLTPSRGKMDSEFKEFFLEFVNRNRVYLVSGSDAPKTVEQVGLDIFRSVDISYNCSGNAVYSQGFALRENNWVMPGDLHSLLLTCLDHSEYPIRTGNHIEERQGAVNFSVVGRNALQADRDAYYQWDKTSNEREAIAELIKNKFPDIDAQVGGETGIDIYKKGADKSQILKDFIGEIDKIVFFGDRCDPAGNDYPIASRVPVYHWVHNWQETKTILQVGYKDY